MPRSGSVLMILALSTGVAVAHASPATPQRSPVTPGLGAARSETASANHGEPAANQGEPVTATRPHRPALLATVVVEALGLHGAESVVLI
jgi:hypothetical protein